MPSGKPLPQDSRVLLDQALRGVAYLNPLLRLDAEHRILSLKEVGSRVHLLCGGGSGHEPSHAAFVGPGMLSAAVCGNIFASPSSQQVTQGLQLLKNGLGTLIITKNYTGDVLHFGIAKERWIAHQKNENIKMVVVGDDVSVGREQGKSVGRRGLAGTVLVYKIAGALASQGASLLQVQALAQYVADHLVTIGVGFDHCKIPGSQSGAGTTSLAPDELEIGMGIHNEMGFKRQKLTDLKALVSDLMTTLTSTTDPDRAFLPFQVAKDPSAFQQEDARVNRVILLLNNLGSMSELEMGAVVCTAGSWLSEKGFQVERAIAGTFMTSLDMPGFSISLVLLPSLNSDVNLTLEDGSLFTLNESMILDLFDAPAQCSGWKAISQNIRPNVNIVDHQMPNKKVSQDAAPVSTIRGDGQIHVIDPKLFVEAVKSACRALITAEPEITKYDTIAGDGDCGETLKSGAQGVLQVISNGAITGKDLVSDILQISEVVDNTMGGTSGGLYSIFFNALAVGIGKNAEESKLDARGWAKASDYALGTLYQYTRARPPSRTLIDPLSAFVLTLIFTPTDFDKALLAAMESAQNTMYVDARVGRTAYLDPSRVKAEEVPDPGAWGIFKLLEGIGSVIRTVK